MNVDFSHQIQISCGKGQLTQIEKMGKCQNLSLNIFKYARDRNKNEFAPNMV